MSLNNSHVVDWLWVMKFRCEQNKKKEKNDLLRIIHRLVHPNWKFICSLHHKMVSCKKNGMENSFFKTIFALKKNQTFQLSCYRRFQSSQNIVKRTGGVIDPRENSFVKCRQRRRKSINLHNISFQAFCILIVINFCLRLL